jgi:GT2 family glycosyltransferase
MLADRHVHFLRLVRLAARRAVIEFMTTEDRTHSSPQERARIASAIEWAERELSRVPPDDRPPRSETSNPLGHGPNDGRYPLDASEDALAYHHWLRRRGEPTLLPPPRRTPRTRRPRFRVPFFSAICYAPEGSDASLALSAGSVFDQRIANWELVVADHGRDVVRAAVLTSLMQTDRRVRSVGATDSREAALNEAIGLAEGEFVVLLGVKDALAPDCFSVLAEVLFHGDDVDVVYADEDRIDQEGERSSPILKPAWSPDLLLSTDYLGRCVAYRRALVQELGGFRPGFGAAAEHDLALRVTERARRIVHVPRIAYHRRSDGTPQHRLSAGPGSARAVADALKRRGEPSAIIEEGPVRGFRNVRHPVTKSPLVSIVIPFRDEPGLLATCAASIRANPGYGRFELVLVDNDSELPETFALIDRLLEQPGVRLVQAPGPFNWSAINNRAVRECGGEMLLFMNNDIEARKPRWLDALVGHAIRPEVGAVGARLLYPDGSIQHAGVVVGLGGLAAHVMRGLPGDKPGYLGMAVSTRNATAVTGACMMTPRALFESFGGFDETLPASFNDVHYCLSLRAAGYLVVYTPLCELVHHESRTRGHIEEAIAVRMILDRWGEMIAAGDPYHNPLLSKWRDWCPISSAQEDARWEMYLTTTVLTPPKSSTG